MDAGEELSMSTAGLSKSRLERMHAVLSGYVERKELPGLVALVSREDDVHVETLGALSVDPVAPMKRDTIFRIASLAKPVTAVAAMILIEECKLRDWEWRSISGATRSFVRPADSVGTAASAHRHMSIRKSE
jgi:CubicO group peptidase (beta-lactamase class C family)